MRECWARKGLLGPVCNQNNLNLCLWTSFLLNSSCIFYILFVVTNKTCLCCMRPFKFLCICKFPVCLQCGNIQSKLTFPYLKNFSRQRSFSRARPYRRFTEDYILLARQHYVGLRQPFEVQTSRLVVRRKWILFPLGKTKALEVRYYSLNIVNFRIQHERKARHCECVWWWWGSKVYFKLLVVW